MRSVPIYLAPQQFSATHDDVKSSCRVLYVVNGSAPQAMFVICLCPPSAPGTATSGGCATTQGWECSRLPRCVLSCHAGSVLRCAGKGPLRAASRSH